MFFKKQSFPFAFLLFIFFLNLISKLLFINSRDIAMDEPFSIFHAQKSFGEIINYFNTASENNPPLYFIALHYWINIFGDSAFSVRFLSVLFSCFTAVVIFKTGEKFFNSFTGITASLVFTFSTLHVYYSHEARTYALFSLLTALSLFFYLNITGNPNGKRNYLFLFLTNLILIYSHYFGFFVLFAQLLCLIFVPNKKNIWKGLLIVFGMLALCYLPHLFVMAERFIAAKSSGTWVAPPAITEYYGNLNRFLNNKYCMAALLGIFSIAFVLLAKNKRIFSFLLEFRSNTNLKIIFLWFFVPYTLMFLLSFRIPMFIDRYILYTSIPFYLFISALIFFLIEKNSYKYILSGVFILSLIFTVQLNPDNNRRLKEAAWLVKSFKKENTIVLIAPEYADLSFAYHYNINKFRDYKNFRKLLTDEKIFPVNSADMVKNILLNHRSDCILFQADTQFSDPDNLILKSVAEKYLKHTEQRVFEIYTIHYFCN